MLACDASSRHGKGRCGRRVHTRIRAQSRSGKDWGLRILDYCQVGRWKRWLCSCTPLARERNLLEAALGQTSPAGGPSFAPRASNSSSPSRSAGRMSALNSQAMLCTKLPCVSATVTPTHVQRHPPANHPPHQSICSFSLVFQLLLATSKSRTAGVRFGLGHPLHCACGFTRAEKPCGVSGQPKPNRDVAEAAAK